MEYVHLRSRPQWGKLRTRGVDHMMHPTSSRCLIAPLAVLALFMAHPQSALAQMLPQLVLERQIDPKLFQKERPLKEALELLLRELRTDSAQLPILVDTEAFKAENPDAYPT